VCCCPTAIRFAILRARRDGRRAAGEHGVDGTRRSPIKSLGDGELTADSLDWLLSPDILAEARDQARARGRDFQALKYEFIGFVSAKGMPDNMNGAFLGFVRSKKSVI
jgi:hypothetical protein